MRLFRYIILLGFFLNPIYSQCDGDSNLDDSVSILDIVLIISHVLENDSLEGIALSNSDTNNDQEVDILDIIIMVNITLSDQYNEVADINVDGIVNILDIIMMVNLLVGGLP